MAIKKGNRGRGASSLTECTLRKDMFYLWTQSEGHLAAIMNPDADGMVCALKEYNGRVFGIQIFVRDPDYNMDTQSAASDTSTPVEIAAVVVTDSATTETATN